MTVSAKSWMAWVTAGALAAFVLPGCEEDTTPGGPGATNTTNEHKPANEDATYTLNLPEGATNIEQGKSHVMAISIDRGDTFNEDVTLTFTPPDGVTIEPAESTIRKDDKEIEFTVKVEPAASLGEKIVEVKGTSASGPPAEGQMKVEITKAEANDAAVTPAPAESAPAAPTEDAANPAAPANPEGGAPATNPSPNP